MSHFSINSTSLSKLIAVMTLCYTGVYMGQFNNAYIMLSYHCIYVWILSPLTGITHKALIFIVNPLVLTFSVTNSIVDVAVDKNGMLKIFHKGFGDAV